MDSSTYTDQSVMTEAQNFISVKINANQQPQVANYYRVEALPTLIWLDSNGYERKRATGGQTPHELVAQMQSAR